MSKAHVTQTEDAWGFPKGKLGAVIYTSDSLYTEVTVFGPPIVVQKVKTKAVLVNPNPNIVRKDLQDLPEVIGDKGILSDLEYGLSKKGVLLVSGRPPSA